MVLPAILNPFVEGAPAAVMTRIALDWIIAGTPLDQLFQEVAEGQYEREFALSHFVQVMLDVACGFRPTARAAFLRRELQRVASISAFYRKLGRMELGITEEVVRRTAQRARHLIVAGDGLLPEPVPGYAARILDGNVERCQRTRKNASARAMRNNSERTQKLRSMIQSWPGVTVTRSNRARSWRWAFSSRIKSRINPLAGS